MPTDETIRTMILPEPAGELWMRARDVINAEMPRREGWERYIGGGTILAADWKHRKSADIDINVPTNISLRPVARAIADELNGSIEKSRRDRVVITTDIGDLDINRAPLEPRDGARTVRIAGRIEPVLSITQILRGKLDRAERRHPVRDAYDIIRCVEDREAAAALSAAYNLLDQDARDAVDANLKGADRKLKDEALTRLELTEETRVDWNVIGTTAAQVLEDHALTRVVLSCEDGRVTSKRYTRNGSEFTDSWDVRDTHDFCIRTGVRNTLEDRRIYIHRMTAGIAAYQGQGRSGVFIDTADDDSIRQFRDAASPSSAPQRPPMRAERPTPAGRTG